MGTKSLQFSQVCLLITIRFPYPHFQSDNAQQPTTTMPIPSKPLVYCCIISIEAPLAQQRVTMATTGCNTVEGHCTTLARGVNSSPKRAQKLQFDPHAQFLFVQQVHNNQPQTSAKLKAPKQLVMPILQKACLLTAHD